MGDEDEALVELRRFFATIPFCKLLKMRVEGLSEGRATMSLPFDETLIGDLRRPALHGGVISALLDTCGGAAVYSTGEAGARTSTIDLRVDYLRPGRPEVLFAEAHVLRAGQRVGVTEIIAFHPGSREAPVAVGRGVYSIRAPL